MNTKISKTHITECFGDMAAPDGSAAIGKIRERLENLKECFRVSGLINSSLQLDEVLENIMTTSRSILESRCVQSHAG